MKSRFTISILACAVLAPLFARCEEASAPAWRDPFWPVGYQPPSARKDEPPPPPPPPVKIAPVVKPVFVPPKPEPDWTAARRMLKVAGYAEANDVRSCFVNGRLVSEGETVTLLREGYRYAWRVVRIDRVPANRQFDELTVTPVEEIK